MTTFDRKALAECVAVAAKCANSKIIPIWTTIKFSCLDGTCTISATNGNLYTKVTCDYTGEDVEFCVDAVVINRLLSTLRAKEIEIELIEKDGGHTVSLKSNSGKKRYSLSYMDPKDFTRIEIGELIGRREVGALDLTTALSNAIPFASRNDLRQEMNYVFAIAREDTMTIFATDTACFYMKEIPARGDGFKNSLVHPSVLETLTMMGKGMLTFYETEKFTVFEMGNTKLIMTKPAVKAPDLLDKIAKIDTEKYISIDAEELKNVMNRLAVFKSDENFSKVVLKLIGENLTIEASDFYSGSTAVEEIEVKNFGVDDMDIGFNSTIISRVITHTEGDNIKLYLTAPSKAMIVMGDDETVKTIASPIVL